MTAVATLLAGIRETLTAATRGPWEEKTDCRETRLSKIAASIKAAS